jgi:hypothetical protein
MGMKRVWILQNSYYYYYYYYYYLTAIWLTPGGNSIHLHTNNLHTTQNRTYITITWEKTIEKNVKGKTVKEKNNYDKTVTVRRAFMFVFV